MLDELTSEYNALDSTQLDRKIELGRKIRSLKLEVDVNIKNMADELNRKMGEIKGEIIRKIIRR